MNTISAKCGHAVPAVGAPHSDARRACERSLCVACSALVHCGDHRVYKLECHWCCAAFESWARMTDAERKLHTEYRCR